MVEVFPVSTGGNSLYPTRVCHFLLCLPLRVSVTVGQLLLNWVKFPHYACSVCVADVFWHVPSHERRSQGSPQVLLVTCLMAVCQLPTSHWLIAILGHATEVCHYVADMRNGWIASNSQIIHQPHWLAIDDCATLRVSPRFRMWRPLTYGWQCVFCLCSPPCWSTQQSTLSQGNTRSSSDWGKSNGSRE